MWNDSGKPYEFIYDSYGKANQMALLEVMQYVGIIRFVEVTNTDTKGNDVNE
jgi:hypothetical protein